MKLRARVLVSVFLFAVAALAVPLVQPASAAGATITVNAADDNVDFDGTCSLREAIQAADIDGPVDSCHAGSSSGPDTITFAPSLNGTPIVLTSSLDVDSPMIIKGNGRTNTAIQDFEFNTGFGSSSTIENMTLVDVNNEDNGATGKVSVINVKATSEMNNNSATGETSTMNVSNSLLTGGVTNNSGIDNTSHTNLTISKSTVNGIIDNNSGSGSTTHLKVTHSKTGEIDNNSGFSDGSVTTASITNTTVSTKAGAGDGVDNESNGTTVTITGSTIVGFDEGVIADGKSTKIVNSTIAGNISFTLDVQSGTTTVLNSTLVKSETGIDRSGGSVKLTNSIVAFNSGTNCTGTVGSGGGNISDDGSCHFSKPHDHNNKNPKLSTLGSHGGPTQTEVPLKGSPAIDGGLNGPCPARDQRGKKRPQDGDGNGTKICDIGSVEVVP